jgi:trk system potassium uptake protein TrkA
MRIVIVGAGMVGSQLAQHLIQEKHDIALIEANEDRARHASNRLDCLVIHDSGNSLRALDEAGIAKADALVCVTGSDEMNMIICGLAPKLRKIARVRNDDYVRFNRQGERVLGIDYFVHPDVEAAQSVLRAVEHGAIGDILSFANTPYELGSITVSHGSAFDGLSLMNFRSLDAGESLITLVERGNGDAGEWFLPTGATVLRRGDRVHLLAKEGEMDRLFTLAGWTGKPLRKIGIVGGGRVGALIAEGLMAPESVDKSSMYAFFKRLAPGKKRRRVLIIEQDYRLCKELAARFPDALILNEDISDEHFVAEERIDGLDLIITAADSQELNIITAVYLKSRGVGRAVALVTGAGYTAVARQLGIDVVIPVKSVIVDSILSHLRGGGVTGVRRLAGGNVKVLELELGGASPVAGRALKDCRMPADTLALLIERESGSFIPRGDHVFETADRVVLLTKSEREGEISRFFGDHPRPGLFIRGNAS